MIVNTNIASLNAQRNLSITNNTMQKSLEKLSSGYRINKASDDAAGLAISEKMRGQIRGLQQATRNAQDGISLIQTAEGALNETHSILQRMRELAVQSANDSNSDADRAEIQKEMAQLKTEIDRISTATEFNTKKLLNGESGTKVTYSHNTNLSFAQISDSSTVTAGTKALAITTAATKATDTGDATVAHAGGTVNIGGHSITFVGDGASAANTASAFIQAVNDANIGITAGGNETGIVLTADKFGTVGNFVVSASAITNALGITVDDTTDNSITGTDVAGTIGGVAGSGSGLTLTGTGANAIAVTFTEGANTVAAKGSVTVAKNELSLQIGANNGQDMSINIGSMATQDLGIYSADASTQAGAKSAITALDTAISLVSSERAKLGAYQNRLDHTINNLGTAAENLTSAESRIRDVDMAAEMSQFTKAQILSQAGVAMLAQANQSPQAVLKLLG